jgi:hypothetical protein
MRLQEARRFLFQFHRCDRLMKRHDVQEGGLKLLPGQGIGVMKQSRFGASALGDGPDGRVLFEAQPQQLNATRYSAAGCCEREAAGSYPPCCLEKSINSGNGRT